MSELAGYVQLLGFYSFIVLLGVAVALIAYMGVRELLAKWRYGDPDGEDAFHPGPFNLRRGSTLRKHFARRHKVQVRDRWLCDGKWVPRE